MGEPIIQTEYSIKPIPDRDHDWCAFLSIYDSGDDQPVGWGASEKEAVVDLLQECATFEDGGAQDMLIELALRGFAAESMEPSE